ncbi:unnamed protein product [Symbiodinium sp. KB8]|nr:unnamed protein product [Symbiodinium sp. KB8]
MLGWAMGSSTGHTTVALWRTVNGTKSLYVCESTALDSYWPTNGIQCTPWAQWLQQAEDADFQVVLAPLNEKYSAKFDEAAAEAFFQSTEGLNYGYYNMLYGWLDTTTQNFPCLPPDWGHCLQWDFLEPAVALVGRLAPDAIEMMFLQAWNHRLGTSGLSAPEIYYEASKQGMKSVDVPVIVEDDNWRYNTTRYGQPAVGRSMVCCVFVCHIWKAAGLFEDLDNEVNCGELTNWDDYALDMFDTSRPEVCQQADPDNQLCQIMGKYTLNLNNLNSKAPYAHMAEHCPSEAPLYTKPANC